MALMVQRRSDKFQVLNSIIGFVVVYMVNFLILPQLPSEVLLHDQPMLKNSARMIPRIIVTYPFPNIAIAVFYFFQATFFEWLPGAASGRIFAFVRTIGSRIAGLIQENIPLYIEFSPTLLALHDSTGFTFTRIAFVTPFSLSVGCLANMTNIHKIDSPYDLFALFYHTWERFGSITGY